MSTPCVSSSEAERSSVTPVRRMADTARQVAANEDRVEVLAGDISERRLGLSDADWDRLTGEVSTPQAYVVEPSGTGAGHTVVAIDLGIKSMTPQRLAERGMRVHVLPARATITDIQALSPGHFDSPFQAPVKRVFSLRSAPPGQHGEAKAKP